MKAWHLAILLVLCTAQASADPRSALSQGANRRALGGNVLVVGELDIPMRGYQFRPGAIAFLPDGRGVICAGGEDAEPMVTAMTWDFLDHEVQGAMLSITADGMDNRYLTPISINPETGRFFAWRQYKKADWRIANVGKLSERAPAFMDRECEGAFTRNGVKTDNRLSPVSNSDLLKSTKPAIFPGITKQDVVAPKALITDPREALREIQKVAGQLNKVMGMMYAVIDPQANEVWISSDGQNVVDQARIEFDKRSGKIHLRWRTRSYTDTLNSVVEAFHTIYAPTGKKHKLWEFKQWLNTHEPSYGIGEGAWKIKKGGILASPLSTATGQWSIDRGKVLFVTPTEPTIAIDWQMLAQQIGWSETE